MGIIINEVCCIDANNLTDFENENNFSFPYKGSNRNISNFDYNKYYLKPFPLNEIKYSSYKNLCSKEVKSLSELPINTQNIIRDNYFYNYSFNNL